MTDSRPDPEAMLRQIKQLHGMKQDGVCITCGMNWPCDAAKLVDALEVAVEEMGIAWRFIHNQDDLRNVRASLEKALASIEERLSR